jgi:hypothetical protein
MKVFRSFIAALLIGVWVVSSASAAEEAEASSEWEKITEINGIVGYSRPTSRSGVYEIKAIGIMDASIAVIEAVLRDDPARTQYSERCIEAFRVDIPGLESSKDTYYIYHRLGMPWPFYDRDGVAKAILRIDEETGALLWQAHTIATDFREDDWCVLRVPIVDAKWILTPLGENKTRAHYQILADPGGYLPTFLVNMMSEDLAVKTIAGIREMVKKDKYKKAKSVVTTTPWAR